MQSYVIGKVIAGIGLFFIGSQMLSHNMRHVTSHKLRHWLKKWTAHPILASLWGVILAVIMQKPNLVTLVVASLLSSKMLKRRAALFIISWSNPGSTFLVFLIFLDVKLVIMYLIGLAGIGLAQTRSLRWTHLFGALFGISLMYYGLMLIKAFSLALKSYPWVESLFIELQGSFLLMLLLGLVLAVLSQSVLTVVVLAINLTSVGLLSFEQCMMVIYGANLGTMVSTLFFIWSYSGVARQAILIQIVGSFLSTFLFIFLFYVEVWGGVPIIKKLVQELSTNSTYQLAFILLFLRICFPILASIFPRKTEAFMERLSPYKEKVVELPKFKHVEKIGSLAPQATLEIVEKDHILLFEYLHTYLNQLKEPVSKAHLSFPKTHQVFFQTTEKIQGFLTKLMTNERDPVFLKDLMTLSERHFILTSLEENVFHLAISEKGSTQHALFFRLLEALDVIILQVIETLMDKNRETKHLLLLVTRDKSPVLSSIREQVQESSKLETHQIKLHLHWVDLFERNIWLLRKYSQLV